MVEEMRQENLNKQRNNFSAVTLVVTTVSFVFGLAWRWETPALKAWVIFLSGLMALTLFWVFLLNYIGAEQDDDNPWFE